jgi:SAM-dependent methyltransferase
MIKGFWSNFRESRAWRALRAVPFLRSTVYLVIELQRSLSEDQTASQQAVNAEFVDRADPFHYDTSVVNHARFARQKSMLDSVRAGKKFASAVEIGCAEGHFTEIVAEISDALLVLDISPVALARTRTRRSWEESVRFQEWDLRRDPIPGKHDLIVVAGVLEYFQRRSTFKRARASLVAGLKPGAYLLLESPVPHNSTVANAWWSKLLIRGKWINAFIAAHADLETVENDVLDIFVITLLRKRRIDAPTTGVKS